MRITNYNLRPISTAPRKQIASFPPSIVASQLPIFQAPHTSVVRGSTTNSTGNFSIPSVVTGVAATIVTTTALDTITLTFSRNPADPYFAQVNIYMLPAGSLTQPVLIASSLDSPAIFTIANPATSTNVVLYVQSINAAGQGTAVTNCPTVVITL